MNTPDENNQHSGTLGPAFEPTRVAKPLPAGIGEGRPTLAIPSFGPAPTPAASINPYAAQPTQRVRPESYAFTPNGDPIHLQDPPSGGDLARFESTDAGIEVTDDLASGRTIREFTALISNLDDRLTADNGTVQIQLMLAELAPHLTLLRPEYVRGILKIFPDLENPNKTIAALEAHYSKTEEVVPGVTKFQAAIRELGRVIGSIFRTPPIPEAAEDLRKLMEGEFEYSFMNFRTSLLRSDNEPPRFTQELRFWFVQLSQEEKAIVNKKWGAPPRPEDIETHLCSKYPSAYHTYVLQIFGERLNGLFANSSIPDEAKRPGFERIPMGSFTLEVGNIVQIWNGNLPLPKTPAEAITGRVTDRVRGTGVFDPEDVGAPGAQGIA